jgi:hypothetical protein
VQEQILQEYPEAKLSIFVLWLKMYEIDSIEATREASSLFTGYPRVAQFYDPERLSGKEVVRTLGAEAGEAAWDVYLFFKGQDKWFDLLPEPVDWVHQLTGSIWADPGRFYQGDQLARKLHAIMEDLLQD